METDYQRAYYDGVEAFETQLRTELSIGRPVKEAITITRIKINRRMGLND